MLSLLENNYKMLVSMPEDFDNLIRIAELKYESVPV